MGGGGFEGQLRYFELGSGEKHLIKFLIQVLFQ